MNIEQATKEVAESLGYMADDAICVEHLPEFSRRLIAKLTESAEPIGYITAGTANWLCRVVPGNSRAETVTKIRPVKDEVCDFPLFTHPAPVPRYRWEDEVASLMCVASAAINQSDSDKRNILEDIADRLCAMLAAAPKPEVK